MRYEEALECILSLAATRWNFGLERVQDMLAALDNPHEQLYAVHIGGTNGKGSTAAMMTSIARAAGLRVGTFTSPHLSSYTERFRLDGVPVAPERLARLVFENRERLETAARRLRPTEFELHTVLAMKLFQEERVDLAVLEVGLGGRLDATNVIRPEVAVITNISLDHQDYLGETIPEIAGEKAGIVKTGVPLVTAAEGEALAVISAVCQERGAPLIRVGHEVRWELVKNTLCGQVLNISVRRKCYPGLELPLAGRHQQVNAACAVAVAEVLGERNPAFNLRAIRRGLANASWPGRFEVLAGEPRVVLDAAHNPGAAEVLRETLATSFPDRMVVLVLGILGDKDRAGITAVLAPAARAVVVTNPPLDRAGDWETVAVEARRYCDQVETVADYRAAVDRARQLAGPEDIVVVTGSIYLLGALRPWLLAQ